MRPGLALVAVLLALASCNRVVLYELDGSTEACQGPADCPSGQECVNDACTCPTGSFACGDSCIPDGSCCTNADCPGSSCPSPGGTCEVRCLADQHVVSDACEACPPGTSNAAGDDPAGGDTSCDATTCPANQHVVTHACTACPPGTTNAAGDDASGADTPCDALACLADQRVVGHACVACPPGSTNAAGDDASGNDTTCDATTCLVDQRVVGHACVACPAGSTNMAGDDATGNDTACDGTACPANTHVVNHVCTPCPAGTSNATGDDASGDDTTCDVILCDADQHVSNHVCTTCPAGSTNAAGDNATMGDTTCDPTLCQVDQHVSNHACMACPGGTTNAAGDDATGNDTTCDPTTCAINEYVSDHACTACPAGTYNAAGDLASGGDTTCDGCGAGQARADVCAGKSCGGFANACGEVFNCGALTTNVPFPSNTSGNAASMANCTGNPTTQGWTTNGTTTLTPTWVADPANCSFTASCGAASCAVGQGFSRTYNLSASQDEGFYEGVVFGAKVGSTGGVGSATIRLSQYDATNATGALLAQDDLPIVGDGAFVTFRAEAAILATTRSLKFEVILASPISSFTFDDFYVQPTDCASSNQTCDQTAGTCSACPNACTGATCGDLATSCGVTAMCQEGGGCTCSPLTGLDAGPVPMPGGTVSYNQAYQHSAGWCVTEPTAGFCSFTCSVTCMGATEGCTQCAYPGSTFKFVGASAGSMVLGTPVCTNDHGNGSCTDPEDLYRVTCHPHYVRGVYNCDGQAVPAAYSFVPSCP